MAQTPKKFLDANGLTYFASLLNDYPTNVVLQTVIDAIDQVKADKTDIVNSDWNATSGTAEILNKPTIPTKTSDLTNDSNFLSGSKIRPAAGGSGYIIHKQPYSLYAGQDPGLYYGKVSNEYTQYLQVGYSDDEDGSKGQFKLSNSGSAELNYTTITPSANGDITITLPSTSGTLALKSEIPTVPSWALAANKPTYTASEIPGLQTLNKIFTFSDSTWTISNNGILSRDGFYANSTDLTYNNAARIILVTNTGTNNPFSNQTFFITKVENNYYSDDDNRYSIQGIVNNKLYNFIVRTETQTTASFESHNVIDLSNYAETSYVDTAIAAIEIPTAELDANVESMLDSFSLDYTSNSSSPNVWQGGSY